MFYKKNICFLIELEIIPFRNYKIKNFFLKEISLFHTNSSIMTAITVSHVLIFKNVLKRYNESDRLIIYRTSYYISQCIQRLIPVK